MSTFQPGQMFISNIHEAHVVVLGECGGSVRYAILDPGKSSMSKTEVYVVSTSVFTDWYVAHGRTEMAIPNVQLADYPENALLPLDIINDLAKRFCIATDDRVKQDIVDQLGTHCINHAEFMRAIHDFAGGGIARAYAIADYTNATKYLRAEQ